MTIQRLEHVQVAMPPHREKEAIAFYEGILGIPQVSKPSHLAPRGGCWFESGDVKIHLGVEQDFVPAKKAHPALLVDDLVSLVQALEVNGFSVVTDTPLEGFDRRYVADPFGNRIELMQSI